MTYYFSIIDNKIISKGQCKLTNAINIEVTKEIFDNSNKYIYQNEQIVLDPEYEAKIAQAEAERVAKLNLTGADVERGIYKAKEMDFDDIVEMVKTLQSAGDERVASLDLKALKIELKANHFYRGNPYVDAVGVLLGFTKEQLDKFFEYNDYTCLLRE